MINRVYFLLIFALTLSVSACGPDEPDDDPCQSDFDQSSLFSHIVDHSIIPGYQSLSSNLTDLGLIKDQFFLLPTQNNLEQFRAKFTEVYLIWQSVAQFEFGPAKEVFLRNSINNFPLNENDLINNIESGNYDLSLPDKYDKGLPALDYLFFGIANSDQGIINKLSSDPDFEKHQLYINAIIDDMQMRITHTLDGWKGSYKETFVSNTGTAAGTALSLLINAFDENYELIKREKIGVPSGVLTLDIPNPDRVEAIHSQLSTLLLKAGAGASVDLFNGVGFDGSAGPGFGDLLDAVNATKDDTLLSDLVSNQFEVMLAELNKISESLDQEIDNNKDQVTKIYAEFTRPLVNIKTDMPSVLCVSITYIDNPSDSD